MFMFSSSQPVMNSVHFITRSAKISPLENQCKGKYQSDNKIIN